MTIDELMQSKVMRKGYIQGCFNAEINIGKVYDYQGSPFRLCGDKIVNDFDLAVRYLKFTNQTQIPIKDAGGRVCMATLEDVEFFANSYAVFGVEQWIKKGMKFSQIDQSTTIEEVNLIEW